MPEKSADLWNFPCAFPIKIMGETVDSLQGSILDIVTRHAPDYDVSTVESRASGNGKYTSLTCTITAVSKEQLDGLYKELTSHPLVKVVL